MDNLAHTLVAVLLAEAGLKRVLGNAPGSTVVSLQDRTGLEGGIPGGLGSRFHASGTIAGMLVVSSNAPDIDVLVSRNPLFFLEHHRGFTHTFWGVALLGILVAGAFCLGSPAIRRAPGSFSSKLALLSGASVVAAASHLLLDFTNSYGVRAFRPFSQEWRYGDLVSIVDPWTYLILGCAGFLATSQGRIRPLIWLAGMIPLSLLVVRFGRGAVPDTLAWARPAWFAALVVVWIVVWPVQKRDPALRRRIAGAGLALLIVYYGISAVAHAGALSGLRRGLPSGAGGNSVIAALPLPGSPLFWNYFIDEGETYRVGVTDWRGGTFWEERSVPKNLKGVPFEMVFQTCPGRIMMRFARFPVLELEGTTEGPVVSLKDLRFGVQPGVRGFASVAVYFDGQWREQPEKSPACPWTEASLPP